MTGASGLLTGHVYVLDLADRRVRPAFTRRWASVAWRPAFSRDFEHIEQATACRQAAVYSGRRWRHAMPYGAGQLQWLAPMS
jgi:hypothetical protein